MRKLALKFREKIPIESNVPRPDNPPTLPANQWIHAGKFLGATVALGLLVAGCGPSPREQELEVQLAAAQKKIAALEAAPDELEGEVFIENKGSAPARLGRVAVQVFERTQFDKFLANRVAAAKAERSTVQPQLTAAEQAHAKSVANIRGLEAEVAKLKQAAKDVDYTLPRKQYFEVLNGIEESRAQKEAALTAAYAAQRTEDAELGLIRLRQLRRAVDRGPYYFTGLGSPLASTKTDADGRFHLRFPHGTKVAVVAMAERPAKVRAAGEDTGAYCWMVGVPRDQGRHFEVVLSNDNLTTSGSPDSLVQTTE